MLKVSEGVHIGHFLNGKFVRVNRAQKMPKKSGFVRHFFACLLFMRSLNLNDFLRNKNYIP